MKFLIVTLSLLGSVSAMASQQCEFKYTNQAHEDKTVNVRVPGSRATDGTAATTYVDGESIQIIVQNDSTAITGTAGYTFVVVKNGELVTAVQIKSETEFTLFAGDKGRLVCK